MPTFRGRPACSCLVAWLPVFEAELKRRKVIKNSIDIYQLIGGAAASGGTHSRGGAFDILQRDAVTVKVAREMGAAFWNRPYNWDNRKGMAHGHGVLNGCPHNSPARYQITALAAGYNGLGSGGRGARDTGPTPRKLRTWTAGIAWAKAQLPKPKPKVVPEVGKWVVNADPFLWGLSLPGSGNAKKAQSLKGTVLTVSGYVTVSSVRWYLAKDGYYYSGAYLTKAPVVAVPKNPMRIPVMTYNPSDKMGNTLTRAKLVAEYVAKGDPSVVAFQELGGRVGTNTPSPWAALVAQALGPKWKVLTPTTAFNENYIAYRVDRLTLKSQSPDHIMRIAGAEGKHCSIAVLTDKASGRSFALGNTHLDPYTSVGNRAKQAVSANAATKAVAVQFGSIPYILCGDFNYESLFDEMKAVGRLDVGHKAKVKFGWQYSTFIGKTPTLDLGPQIDFITIGDDATVEEARIIQILDATGKKYKMPLAGDHIPKFAIILYP